eukprot:EG_transcript_14829
MPRRQLPRPPQAAKRRPAKDALAALPSIEEQYKKFMEDGPLQRMAADVEAVLKDPQHNPHGGSLTTGALKAILQRRPDGRYTALFADSKTMDTFHGLLSSLPGVSIFQWQAEGAVSKEWRVRLRDCSAKSCARRDQRVFAALKESRQRWLGVAKQLLQETQEWKLSVLRRRLMKPDTPVPSRTIMLRMLSKQRWVTLKGTRGLTQDWKVLLNPAGLQETPESTQEPDSDSDSDEGRPISAAAPRVDRKRQGKKAPRESIASGGKAGPSSRPDKKLTPEPPKSANGQPRAASRHLEKVRRFKQLRKERKKRSQQRKRASPGTTEASEPAAKKPKAA